jgi:glycine cleavage system H lipoate-binding protein/ABC-type phosphate transport system substrate-binding protein
MKNKVFLFIFYLLLSFFHSNGNEIKSEMESNSEGTIKVYASPDLYQMSLKWADEFTKLNPNLSIHVTKSEGYELNSKILSGEGLGFSSAQFYSSESNHPEWNMVIGREVIVPVMNIKNPFLNEIGKEGISVSEFKDLIKNKDNKNWNKLSGNSGKMPFHFYISSDLTVNKAVVDFLKTDFSLLDDVKSINADELISVMQNDPGALGFCTLQQITDQNNQSLVPNLQIVPIDKNGNGQVDYIENIYENLQTFSRGVWIGKFPKELSVTIYSIATQKPQNENEKAFLKWIITDGQPLLAQFGYSDLYYAEKTTQLAKLDQPVGYASIPVDRTNGILGLLLLALLGIILISVILDLVFRRISKLKSVRKASANKPISIFNEGVVAAPAGLYFDKTHTWAFRKKNGNVKIGIDDFIPHVTGEITRVEMKNIGDRIKKGETLLSIVRKGKLLNIYSPVSGTIKDYNKDLKNNSSLLNSDPYTNGWVYEIEPVNWGLEIQYLIMAEQYKIWLKDEFNRLKDFFATTLKISSPEFETVILQDGGTVKDHILADLEPAIWEDFQMKFIDPSR